MLAGGRQHSRAQNEAKRARLAELLVEVQKSIDYIDWKQGFYDDVLAGRTEYASNLLPR